MSYSYRHGGGGHRGCVIRLSALCEGLAEYVGTVTLEGAFGQQVKADVCNIPVCLVNAENTDTVTIVCAVTEFRYNFVQRSVSGVA